MLAAKKIKRLGIMGGTFDPVHYGHLVTAETARAQFNFDKVVFVPSGYPPHKIGQKITEARHRYLMTVLAVTTNIFFEVSRIEIDRQGYSYAIDTVSQIKEKYGQEWEIYFITGADAVLEILTWKNIKTLIEMCTFVAATRPGFDLSVLDNKLEQISSLAKDKFLTFEVPALSISSTDIRQRVASGKPIKYLLPESVERYIFTNNLYKEGKEFIAANSQT
ncbi:nicotinate-nucleotide adenylyltransferase [Desulfitibacter alkalitolerans]|uniref:nicotinate-nucleotide adenylyltransferase n=1 Tax=Desulfitibacter alkalitolerans TaxID=264641 RepID=UPI000A48C324|nr:nicotinate-nucleotide adenylyltransferase [Desulfitibacter alkalitolerans]